MLQSFKISLMLVLSIVSYITNAQQYSDNRGPKATDLYAFRSPDNQNTITIIANFSPMQSPQSGPGYPTFESTNTRYEIHVENDGTTGDDITYRFTFSQVNQDPTTVFAVRLGQQNYKTSYVMEKSVNGGVFSTIANGSVPPPNIGPRSISNPIVGLGASDYNALVDASFVNASSGSGEIVFCGHADDPFFMDLGGFYDIANTRPTSAMDGFGHKNIHSIVLQVPISTLQKNGQPATAALNILDSDYTIGLWASTSQKDTRTLSANGSVNYSGSYVQTSRVGMPLVDDVIIPIGDLNAWQALTPYNENPAMENYFCNPELGLYMDNSLFGGAIPAWASLRIQRNSLQSFDFGNTNDGLWPILATNGGAGTALDVNLFGNYLLRQGQPRSYDILPLYHTGLPNLPPYHLATGKNGNPLADGKPFINNFLPTFGDMLRLNMAVPATQRNDPQFSSMGLLQANLLGITTAPYNTNASLEWIPNMDGFPNGRRLEDDVVRITLQLFSGALMAHTGLFYDDYTAGGTNPITADFLNVMTFTTGLESNDTTFKLAFPYVQTPWVGTGLNGPVYLNAIDTVVITTVQTVLVSVTDTLFINVPLGLTPPNDINLIKVYPNPTSDILNIDNGNFANMSGYTITIINSASQTVFTSPVNQQLFTIDLTNWSGNGIYYLQLIDTNGNITDIRKVVIE
jgi:hypothetical protein